MLLTKKDGGFEQPPIRPTNKIEWWEDYRSPEENFNDKLAFMNSLFGKQRIPTDSPMWAREGEFSGGTFLQKAEPPAEIDHTDSDGQPLEKRVSGMTRRASVRRWVASQLALGKSVAELADFARRHDPLTALMIEEEGQKL